MLGITSLCLLFVFSQSSLVGHAKDIEWQSLEKGLKLTQLSKNEGQNSLLKSVELGIYILKIDPDFFNFRLLSASEYDSQRKSLKDWIKEFDLVAGINASMFWQDFETSTGYMRNFDHINNDLIHPDYNAFLCFNPHNPDISKIQIIDRKNDPEWKNKIDNYHTVIQNYRMISSNQNNVWEDNDRSYSVAAIGMEKKSNHVLFILSRKPRTIHELNSILLSSRVSISVCMFVEGGPTAGLYIKSQSIEQGCYGLSTKALWSSKPESLNKIPNVIGIERK